MSNKLLPKRPYLLRAYYDWLIDSELTPYLVVDATYFGVNVPIEYVKDGQIVLNLSPNATGNFLMNNQAIQFSARFQGVSRDIYIPMGAALAIYARENGDGVMFEPESIYEIQRDEQPLSFAEATDKKEKPLKSKQSETNKNKKSPSHLRIIK
ncbi:stringent starvation protein B [Bisgaardia hudsonensis]|uniref:Stringent starvation protein B n=1 Tax=Bisgaardia hudsonensis TaxID=109472 RepID=A0A4R2N190_9PAST|nr:ClpXP protease specificity-enhancing factor [Bisgaardia hudsonensis]QLB13146.1 ClpXP protease specificity-enhancing factor [Bisgaardia hudsonensis]TCP13283.1 stringent starvation protein B [Bisgaardia hudsonensis]